MMKRCFYPFVLGLYPILFLYARNFYEVSPNSLIVPILAVLFTIAAVLSVSRAFFGDMSKAGVFTALFSVLFFSYAQITGVIYALRLELGGVIIGPNKVMLPAVVLALVVSAAGLKRAKRSLAAVPGVLNAVSLALVLFFLFDISPKVMTIMGAWPDKKGGGADIKGKAAYGEAPDIYCIVLDAYTRGDVMKDVYGYDNSAFLASLRQDGFYVADKSTSDYNTSIHSLFSLLNFDYLPFSPERAKGILSLAQNAGEFKNGLHAGLLNNKVFRFLRERGYTIIGISSYDFPSLRFSTDRYLEYAGAINPFQYAIMENTPLSCILRLNKPFWRMVAAGYRKKINYVFESLEDGEKLDVKGPVFVYAHVMSPHSPFVFDRNGDLPDHDVRLYNYEWPDTREPGMREGYIKAYSEQARYIAERTVRCIGAILKRNNGKAPIIIVEGDHGGRVGLDWGDLERGDPRDFFCILNAYYLPGGRDKGLYPGISPVNTFRVIFNNYFGAGYPLLEDRNFVVNMAGRAMYDYTGKVSEEEENMRELGAR